MPRFYEASSNAAPQRGGKGWGWGHDILPHPQPPLLKARGIKNRTLKLTPYPPLLRIEGAKPFVRIEFNSLLL